MTNIISVLVTMHGETHAIALMVDCEANSDECISEVYEQKWRELLTQYLSRIRDVPKGAWTSTRAREYLADKIKLVIADNRLIPI